RECIVKHVFVSTSRYVSKIRSSSRDQYIDHVRNKCKYGYRKYDPDRETEQCQRCIYHNSYYAYRYRQPDDIPHTNHLSLHFIVPQACLFRAWNLLPIIDTKSRPGCLMASCRGTARYPFDSFDGKYHIVFRIETADPESHR